MLFLFGKRDARIARFMDTEHICYRCKSFDREVTAWRPYFHVCFIPCFPVGPKKFEMRCVNCGDDTQLESVLNEYRNKTGNGLYLWSGTILTALLAVTWFVWNSGQQEKTADYLAHPLAGDVYTIAADTNEGTSYSFLMVAASTRDSVYLLANKTSYLGLVSDLADDDYFVAGDTIAYPVKKLIAMRADKELSRIQRGFSKNSSFARIK